MCVWKPIGVTVFWASALAVAVTAARADELHVPDPYPTIQVAIDAANPLTHDVVIVADGTYTDPGFYNVDFLGKAITVRSDSDNPEDCTIDCAGGTGRRGFLFQNVETSGSILRGFTITGGNISGQIHGGAIICTGGSSPTITNCRFESNHVGDHFGNGGAIGCLDRSNPIISNCYFVGNQALGQGEGSGKGGAIYCDDWSSPVIINCTFDDNRAAVFAGAIYCDTGRPIIMHCTVKMNAVLDPAHSHAIYFDSATPAIVNCVIHDNENRLIDEVQYYGGGIACVNGSSPLITNCTVADNSTGNDNGGALHCEGESRPVVTNCILWDNGLYEIVAVSGDPIVTYSDVQGGWTGTGNLDSEPEFVPRAGEPGDPWAGEYYLSQKAAGQGSNSPCINVGSDTVENLGFFGFTTRTDRGRDEDDSLIDMGYHYPPDCNTNDIPDFQEILDGEVEDCNYNGIPDSCDIGPYGSSSDANGDGIPDECQGIPEAGYFSTDQHFDLGTLINVNHAEPLADQLQRNELATPLDYLNVAASDHGTLVRIYTGDDPQIGDPGDILGEYFTAPGNPGSSPSRTSVDLDGSVWVTNRTDEVSDTGSVVKIGLLIGGTACDATGIPNDYGEYLKPPFQYNTCVDRDGDGLIRTSRTTTPPGGNPITNLLPWPDQYPQGDITTADDECICKYLRVLPTGTRYVAVNADNNVWISGHENLNAHEFVLLDGETGEPMAGGFNVGAGGYGGLIDCNGVIWSARSGLLRYGTTNNEWQVGDCPNSYVVGIDRDGNIWSTRNEVHFIRKLDPDGIMLFEVRTTDPPYASYPKGVAVTLEDNDVWVANTGLDTVRRLDNGGGFVEDVAVGEYPSAVAVDANGYVWVTNQEDHTVSRIIPGTPSSSVEHFSLRNGAGPYDYSDMTGQVTLHTSATGTWNVIHDSDVFGAEWHVVAWNRESCANPHVPEGTTLTVEVRAADLQTALTSQAYVLVEDGTWFDGVEGKFLEIRVRFKGSCPGVTFETPVLCDLRAHNALGDCNCDGSVDAYDNDPFVLALTNPTGYASTYPNCNILTADTNCDGEVNSYDIDPFVYCMVEGACACINVDP